MRRNGKKKLAKLVFAALLSTGGVLFSASSVVSAAVEVNGDGADITGNADTTTPSGNTLNMNSGTVTAPLDHALTGGKSDDDKEASRNIVNINGGTIEGNVVGGNSVNGDAKDNIINIYKVTDITGQIYGGIAWNGTSSGNIVNILGTITITGALDGDGTQAINIASKGNTVGKIYSNPQNINFFLPEDMTTKDVMLTVTGKAEVDGTKIGVMAKVGSFKNLKEKDKVTLLHAGELQGTVTKTTDKIIAPESLTKATTVEYEIDTVGNDIVATINKVNESGGGSDDNDILKSPVETKAASVTLLNAGADMLASQGFAQAANAVAVEAAEQAKNGATGAPVANSFTPFAAFGGSSIRAESGSHVDTKGFGINVGFAKEFANSQGKLLFGPVVEYGGGKYDSYNNNVHGDGGSHYWGFGLMARQTNHDGFYYEGSLRYGRVTSDYNAEVQKGVNASYDSASNYWAAHLGLGKVFAAGKQDTVDTYLKYFYSHQGGDDTTIHITGGKDEEANFDSVNSNRIRIGARYTHKINEMNSLYGGLAYQYEFGGEARAHYSISGEAPSPSIKGSSGMLELGWQVKPNNGPLTLDLGVTGWAGKQRGGSVQLGATWTF